MKQNRGVFPDSVTKALEQLLAGGLPEEIRLEGGEHEQIRALVETVNRLTREHTESRNFLLALSEGRLDVDPPRRNHLISHFKQLHANLRHLTWQTQQITKGDLNQRVDFLGAFSTSFNAMIDSLREKKVLEEQLKEANERLARQATTDALTGIANRAKFNEALGVEFSRVRRYGFPLTVVLFDIDHFKRVNDTFGHTIGDVVLKELAQRVSTGLRQEDMVARWGGEEFVVLLSHADLENGAVVAERLRNKVALDPFTTAGPVTCSFGVAQFQTEDDGKTLLERADKALYRAKENGRNRVEKEERES
jgi:two-component system, cell cycle response regulator